MEGKKPNSRSSSRGNHRRDPLISASVASLGEDLILGEVDLKNLRNIGGLGHMHRHLETAKSEGRPLSRTSVRSLQSDMKQLSDRSSPVICRPPGEHALQSSVRNLKTRERLNRLILERDHGLPELPQQKGFKKRERLQFGPSAYVGKDYYHNVKQALDYVPKNIDNPVFKDFQVRAKYTTPPEMMTKMTKERKLTILF